MLTWTPYPFVRIIFFFCAGIILGIYLPHLISLNLALAIFISLSLIFIIVSFLKAKGKLKAFNPGFMGLLMLLLAGYIQVYYSTESNDNNHFIQDGETILNYQVVITKQAQEKENSWKAEAEVLLIQQEEKWKQRKGNVLLYFSKTSFPQPFVYGDVLLIQGSPKLLSEPANPGEFDYKQFLTFRKIYHQHFLRSTDVKQMGHEPPNHFIDYSIRARVWAGEALHKHIHGKCEQATASALVLGVTDGLDDDLLSAYSATGSLHVLSVSGLHVGIIYWLILLILKPLNKTTTGKWALAIFSITVLWSYAFVTGLSPSVLRAVTMFSFVAIARPWSRRTNIYNTLAASAFCLLLFEPYLIMSVGFQLSYLAVIGIVYLQPIFARWWEPRSWVMDQVWQITCVSLAAQAATFILGLLYFHQFPVYFLFSNLIVIPLSFVVLVLGILLITVSSISVVGGFIGLLLQWTIKVLNYGVIEMESLPFSLIDGVYITTVQSWILMITIVFIMLLIRYRKFYVTLIASTGIVLFSYLQWNHFYRKIDTSTITVYRVAGHGAFDIIDQGHAYFFTDSVLQQDQERIRFHIRPNRLQSGVTHVYHAHELGIVEHFKGCTLVVWRGISILLIQGKEFSMPAAKPDYVIIGHNSIRHLKQLSGLNFKQVILDSSNSFYFADNILKEARTFSMNVHSVLHQGAFTVNIEKE